MFLTITNCKSIIMMMIYTFLFVCLNFQYTSNSKQTQRLTKKYNLARSVVEPPVKSIELEKNLNI